MREHGPEHPLHRLKYTHNQLFFIAFAQVGPVGTMGGRGGVMAPWVLMGALKPSVLGVVCVWVVVAGLGQGTPASSPTLLPCTPILGPELVHQEAVAVHLPASADRQART